MKRRVKEERSFGELEVYESSVSVGNKCRNCRNWIVHTFCRILIYWSLCTLEFSSFSVCKSLIVGIIAHLIQIISFQNCLFYVVRMIAEHETVLSLAVVAVKVQN